MEMSCEYASPAALTVLNELNITDKWRKKIINTELLPIV